jgi:hypothetical protein
MTRATIPVLFAVIGCATSQPAASAPAPSASTEPKAQPREVSPPDVHKTIKASLDDFALCAQTSWANAKGQVAINVQFVIQPNGRASTVTVVEPPPDTLDLQQCVKDTILQLQFPTADIPTNARYPFYFEPM